MDAIDAIIAAELERIAESERKWAALESGEIAEALTFHDLLDAFLRRKRA